ncbi:hypothetical protein Tco_1275944 [Tanacetum coccineum]
MSRLTMKLAIKESKTQLHISQPSGSSAHEGTGVTSGVPDVPIYGSDEEKISWKSIDDEDDDDEANIAKDEDDNDQDDDERTKSDNDGYNFVHPKLSTHDDEARKDDEVNEEESNDESNEESNEESDEEVQGANTEEEEIDEEATHEEDEANELYRDVNVNLEGRDTVMTDAPLPNVQATQETEDTHVILTTLINPEGQQQSSSVSSGFVSNMLNPKPDTGIDLIFTLDTEATSLVDVLVTTIAESPLVSAQLFLHHPLLSSHICNKHQFPHQQLFQAPPCKIFLTLALYSGSTIDLKLWKLTSLSSSKRTNLLKQFLPFLALLMRTLPTRCMKPSKLLFSYNPKDSEMKLKPKTKTFSINLMTT